MDARINRTSYAPSNIRPKAPTSIAPMLALIFFTTIKRIFHKKSKCEKKTKLKK
jgi:hypothetical protein